MVGMKEDAVFVRGVWVPFGDKIINEMFKLMKLKHGSKFKKLVANPNHEKIVDFLTARQGKWEASKKNHTTLSTEAPSLKRLRFGSTSSLR